MSADAPAGQTAAVKVNPNGPTEETVLAVEHYTDRLFRFRLTRPQSFRFRSGEFVMIGLLKVVFNAMDYVLPPFAIRELGEGVRVGRLNAINGTLNYKLSEGSNSMAIVTVSYL